MEPRFSRVDGAVAPTIGTPWLDALVVTASGHGGEEMATTWLRMAREAKVAGLVGSGSKVPSGFLRAAGDLLKVMAEHTKAYLHPLLSMTVEMLAASSDICESTARAREAKLNEPDPAVDDDEVDEDDDVNGEDEEDANDTRRALAPGQAHRDARVRSLAVRFLGALFQRHPDFDYSPYWDAVLSAVKPMADRMAAESAASHPPPALSIVAALAEDDVLAPLLERADAITLLPQLWRALGAPFASPPARPPPSPPPNRSSSARRRPSLRRSATTETATGKEETRENTSPRVCSARTPLRCWTRSRLRSPLGRQRSTRANPRVEDRRRDGEGRRSQRGRLRRGVRQGTRRAETPRSASRSRGGVRGHRGYARAGARPETAGRIRRRGGARRARRGDPRGATTCPRKTSRTRATPRRGIAPRSRRSLADCDRGRRGWRCARRGAPSPRHDEAANACAGILRGFHADARGSIDGVDYDARLGAYDECTEEWFCSAPPRGSFGVESRDSRVAGTGYGAETRGGGGVGEVPRRGGSIGRDG